MVRRDDGEGDQVTDHGADDVRPMPGEPRVDAALAALDELDSLDLAGQLTVFTQVQAALALILDSPDGIDDGAAPLVDDGATLHMDDSAALQVDDRAALQMDDSAAHSPAS
jgi:hypothetical protein